jgi:hypothetical protein
MEHWKRTLIPDGFKWKSPATGTDVVLQIRDNRWKGTVSVLLASGERHSSSFFVEDSYDASLQKCLLYVWRALTLTDKSTFELQEALADLRRFAP